MVICTQRRAAAMASGTLLFLVALLGSCVYTGASASTSWPSKVHGRAGVAGGEDEGVAHGSDGAGPAEASAEPKIHLGLPGERDGKRVSEFS